MAVFEALAELLREARPVALATVVEGGEVGAKLLVAPDRDPVGTLGDRDLDRVVARDALGELHAGRTSIRHYGPSGEARQTEVAVFVESFAPPPHMVILGAVDFTAALARLAKLLGYRVTVCDARAVFATPRRFPMADAVVADWPHRYLRTLREQLGPRDAACVLTHDHKFDVPSLVELLQGEVGYIGTMGSRRTCEEREKRLRDEGVDDEDLARIMAPIGLDLGARTPEETAVSICAEIIARSTGREGIASLKHGDGAIHRAG